MNHFPETRLGAAICTHSRYALLERSIASLITQNIDADQYKIVKVDHLVHLQRINQSWLRRRRVWQAVSGFISRPEKTMESLDQWWQSLLRYLRQFSADSLTPTAYFEAIDSPVRFEQQLYAAQCSLLYSTPYLDRVRMTTRLW